MIKKLLFLTTCLAFLFSVWAADNTKTVTVSTSATEIVKINPKGRRVLTIYNNDTSTTIYLGFSSTDCTVATGLPLPAQYYVKFKEKSDPIYGIVASGTAEVRVWEDER